MVVKEEVKWPSFCRGRYVVRFFQFKTGEPSRIGKFKLVLFGWTEVGKF